ncbi:hypothetical protein niasHT_020005 [Heterodera trifolii]|uniref:Uncharacterized protein n=1 Tax=Heterodera trifolii TaxID=157864 RepID=A0ABD2L5U2_9BILA
MDYEDDTLTNANKNRAASRKVFQQWGSSTKQTEWTTQPKQQQVGRKWKRGEGSRPMPLPHLIKPTDAPPHLIKPTDTPSPFD